LLKDVGGPVSGQRSTPSAGEQDPVATIATLGNPGPQRAGSSGPQWDTAFLAALALEVKQRGPSESEVVLTESENLRDTGSGIIERQQQGVIAQAHGESPVEKRTGLLPAVRSESEHYYRGLVRCRRGTA
jgi:hypothetical protein